MTRYLDGLVNGDAQAVVSSVGGRFVEERSDLAGNTSYPGRIKEHYSDASFNVVSFRTLPRYAVTDSGIRQDVIAVTVDILKGGELADEVVLIFARDDGGSASGAQGLSAVSQYRIVDEIDPSELPP